MSARPARPAVSLRRGRDRKIAGVCSGLAEAGGVDPWVVRVGFILLASAGGLGVALYLALAIALPDADAPAGTGLQWDLHLRHLRQPVGAVFVTWGTLLLVQNLGAPIPGGAVYGVSLGVGGVAMAYTSSGAAERARVRGVAARLGSRDSVLRLLLGGVLVLSGLAIVFATGNGFSVLRQVVLAAAVTLAGLGLILYPWVRGLVQDLNEERRVRIRSEERAEVAAHLHDSVLQTLALIQRNADRPRELVALARRQERELRSWLYGERHPDAPAGSLAAAVTAMAEEVEERHGVAVEAVTVGDHPGDERVDALVQTAREAVVNAAKHSGADVVSVYVEGEPNRISAFVRDRGKGFDPAAVPDDRRGIAESIVHRMTRHGGTATISSTPGEGTEVALEVAW